MNDAEYARLVDCAMAMAVTAGLTTLAPPADPRLTPDWVLRGHLIANDHLGLIDQRVCYGFFAQRTGTEEYAAVIRGTHGTLEWIEDAEFCPMHIPPPGQGYVEQGFWGVYESLCYVPLGGEPSTLPAGLLRALGDGKLTVVGHSLGAAIATYAAYDLAAFIPDRLAVRLFASPHPGNAEFCASFHARVKDYVVYDYEPDVVPVVPLGPDYTSLPNRTLLPSNPRIRRQLDCYHTITTYEWLLDPSAVTESACFV